MINDFDCDFFTPSPPTKHDDVGLYTALATQVHLARVAGRIHRLLYSPEAARTSMSQYRRDRDTCEAELESWRQQFMPYFPKDGKISSKEFLAKNLETEYPKRNHFTYLHLLCNIKRAIPVTHTMDDGRKVSMIAPEAIEMAMSMIRIAGIDERWIDPASW